MERKIITHNDFDGVISAAIVSWALGISKIRFAGPTSIINSTIQISDEDVVCDLPYPLTCGLWFDHHEGNLEELKHRGIELSSIKGRFSLEDSCARVVYGYFSERMSLPQRFERMVEEVGIIDSFGYRDLEDWRRETPGKVISDSLKFAFSSQKERTSYLHSLIELFKESTIEDIASLPRVRELFELYKGREDEMLKIIESSSYFLDEDKEGELIILDLTHHPKEPQVYKNLALLLYPEALGILEVKCMYLKGKKTNNLKFSIALSFKRNGSQTKDVGKIMRELNLGDGHRGAAGGRATCKSKYEMLKKKGELISSIFHLWKSQA